MGPINIDDYALNWKWKKYAKQIGLKMKKIGCAFISSSLHCKVLKIIFLFDLIHFYAEEHKNITCTYMSLKGYNQNNVFSLFKFRWMILFE